MMSIHRVQVTGPDFFLVGLKSSAEHGVPTMLPILLALLLSADVPSPPDASTVRAVWLADLDPARVQPGPGRFGFVPGSATNEVDGCVLVEAAGPPGVLHTVHYAAGERGEDLDIQASVVVERVLAVGRTVEYTPRHRSHSVRAVPPMSEVTRILAAIEQGDAHAVDQLLPLVYNELRQLAAQKLAQETPGQTLEATALVHEAYLRLVDTEQAQHWDSPGPFLRRSRTDHAPTLLHTPPPQATAQAGRRPQAR